MKKTYLDEHISFEKRVDNLVNLMTLEEKVSQMVHFSKEIKRLDVPAYTWWNEALHGVARAGTATVFPQAIGLAATFDENMMFKVASIISDEARAKHHEFLRRNDTGIYKGLTMWSPNINIFRDPRWGRGHETYGEDPYLTSRMGVNFVKGMQGNNKKYLKTIATPKHYVVHSGPEKDRHHFNAIVSQKDLRETYLLAFKDCIEEGGAYSIMGAYNRTNDEACCASYTLLQTILRDEFKFDGFIVSDCHAICDLHLHHKITNSPAESAALAVKNGCDLNCGETYKSLLDAYKEGLITEEEIDTAVKRLFMGRFKLGMFDKESDNPYAKIPYEINDCQAHRDYSVKTAEKSVVLLKNNGILPLSKSIKKIAVVGPNADKRGVLLANYNGIPSRYSTILEGIVEKFDKSEVMYSEGCHIVNKTVRDDETTLISEAVSISNICDVTIIVTGINSQIEGEEADERYPEFGGGDRMDIELPGNQNKLISEIAKTGKPIIVINLSGSAIALNIANKEADAILQGWYPGALGGKAIANILCGDVSPSGKLPVTFYKSIAQLPPFTEYELTTQTYRYMKETPLFPFGFGLTYSDFVFSNINLTRLDEYSYKVTFNAKNIGNYTTSNAIQMYIKTPTTTIKSPKYQLKGFKNEFFNINEEKELSFIIDEKAMSFIDNNGKRVILEGEHTIFINDGQPDEYTSQLYNRSGLKVTFTIDSSKYINY